MVKYAEVWERCARDGGLLVAWTQALAPSTTMHRHEQRATKEVTHPFELGNGGEVVVLHPAESLAQRSTSPPRLHCQGQRGLTHVGR